MHLNKIRLLEIGCPSLMVKARILSRAFFKENRENRCQALFC